MTDTLPTPHPDIDPPARRSLRSLLSRKPVNNPELGKATPEFGEMQASAMRADLSSRRAVRAIMSYRQQWQEQAMHDTWAIGELAFGISTPSAMASRVQIGAAKAATTPDASPDLIPTDTTDKNDAYAENAIADLGNTVTITDLIYDMAFNLLATGEGYLVYLSERAAKGSSGASDYIPPREARWMFLSIKEVETSGSTLRIFDDAIGNFENLDYSKGDTFIRIWRPDPFMHRFATSHIRAILGPAEELLWWDAAGQAAAKNRLVLAGLIGVPHNFDVPSVSAEDAKLKGSERFIYQFLRNGMISVQDPTSAGAALPMMYTYPANENGKSGLDVHEFQRPQDELLESRSERCLIRIERGMNLPAGVISGLGEATNWGGSQIEESTFRDHIEPIILLICSALTRAYLQPLLVEAKAAGEFSGDPYEYFVWYDASNLIVHRDKSANALRARELLLISGKASRRELGYSETDAPTREEIEQFIIDLGAIRKGPSQEGIVDNPSQTSKTPEDPGTPPNRNAPDKRTTARDDTAATSGKGQPVIQRNSSLALAIPALQTLCDDMCRRALEVANNRLKNKANKNTSMKATLRNVATMAVAPTLGREACTKLGMSDLFTGAFDGLDARFLIRIPDDTASANINLAALKEDLRVICADNLFTSIGPKSLVDEAVIHRALGLDTSQ